MKKEEEKKAMIESLVALKMTILKIENILDSINIDEEKEDKRDRR